MNREIKTNGTKILALLLAVAMILGMNGNASVAWAAELHTQESVPDEELTEIDDSYQDGEILCKEEPSDEEENPIEMEEDSTENIEEPSENVEEPAEDAAIDEALSEDEEAAEEIQPEDSEEEDEMVNFELDDKLLGYFGAYYRDRNEFLATLYEHPQNVPVKEVEKITQIIIYYNPDMSFSEEDFAQINLKDIRKFTNLETLIVYGDNKIKIDVGDNVDFFPQA